HLVGERPRGHPPVGRHRLVEHVGEQLLAVQAHHVDVHVRGVRREVRHPHHRLPRRGIGASRGRPSEHTGGHHHGGQNSDPGTAHEPLLPSGPADLDVGASAGLVVGDPSRPTFATAPRPVVRRHRSSTTAYGRVSPYATIRNGRRTEPGSSQHHAGTTGGPMPPTTPFPPATRGRSSRPAPGTLGL